MAKPRNNVAKLPPEIRFRIFKMLDNEATNDDIRNDPDVIAACQNVEKKEGKPLVLHNSSISAFRCSSECFVYHLEQLEFNDHDKARFLDLFEKLPTKLRQRFEYKRLRYPQYTMRKLFIETELEELANN